MGNLKGHYIIRGILKCENGLRIGGSKDTMDIGGTDNPILRHPISNVPYIPGSSLKGKIRSLLEQKHRPSVMQSGRPCDCGQCDVCIIFGCSKSQNTQTLTRSIFRDSQPTKDSLQLLEKERVEKGLFYAESKAEVAIDRKTGKVGGGGPRWQERVPEGTEFDIEIVLRYFEGDNIDNHIKFIKEGIALLENDTLGGSGSRGYGKVKFRDIRVEEAKG
ncbi:MAG: type III-A CRISPR-associated RAMP protein Csm3 [bacterium]